MIPFYMATWEEYYTNAMILPIFNGATEGCIIASGVFIFTGIKGVGFWNTPCIGKTPYNLALLYGIGAYSILTIFLHVNTVRVKVPERLTESLFTLLPLGILLLTLTLGVEFSITKIEVKETKLFIVFFGFHFAKLASLLQIAHVANMPYNGFRRTSLLLFAVFLAVTFVQYFQKTEYFSTHYLLISLTILSFLIYAHLVFNVIKQFTRVLEIKVFRIKPKGNQLSALHTSLNQVTI
eukprot:TRINITY_DN6235_c0_g1_i3.p1 TRINITY_DN6235_c0_g1~~TRINITY_DN6235_c0_g1_i3.p1  ORF type:complete len:237 (-),score=27.55 TRINITY_DN6235_c0_g1_i3:297-1007(-)